jgi:hypothetical protein
MERVGFFDKDITEPVAAFLEQVEGKKRKVEGLEISIAGSNPGIGDGIRRIQALNRMDIPQSWRMLIRPGHKKDGPMVSLLAPRGRDASEISSKVSGIGPLAPVMNASTNSLDCAFPPNTPASTLVTAAADAMRAIGFTAELQWTVRAKGTLPE